MIKSNRGSIEITGPLPEILTELSDAIEAIHGAAAQQLGKEAADKLIALAGRTAFMSGEELAEYFNEKAGR